MEARNRLALSEGQKENRERKEKINLDKKILLGIMTIGLVAMLAGTGLYAYFTDTETSVGNVFTAGTIDISIDPTVGQKVTLNGFVDLKPCQTGYTTTKITNVGPNSATLWKHVTNVDNREHGITDAEGKYYAANPDSENRLLSNWIHYDMSVYKSLGYSWSGTVGDQPVSIDVEDGECHVTWTIDFPIDDDPSNGLMAVGLIIALDGEGNGPAFQIHNNDGTDPNYNWGTWLLSPWGPTIADGWFGWHSSSINTPVSDLDWVSATGGRYKDGKPDCPEPNPNGIFTITIDKCKLVGDIHWALYTAIGSGFSTHAYQQATHPDAFSWGDPIVDMSKPNYEAASISTLIKEIPEADGWDLTGADGVASKWINLGTLEPGECMCVIQSYHLDATVDNWGQSDRVFFDIEFLAQQTEGSPPPPGPVLPGHG